MKKILMVILVLASLLLFAIGCGGSPGSATSVPTISPTQTSIPVEELFLELTEPFDESISSVSRIPVSGKTLPDAVVSINGIIAAVDYQGIFHGEVNLEAGPNIIEIITSDFYGNEKSSILTVIYVAALPLTVTDPLNNTVVVSQSLTVKGITNADAVVSINGKVVSVDASGHFSEPVTLEVGPNLIEVLASDFYGNSANVMVTVIYSP